LNTFFEDDIEWLLEAEKEKDLQHEGRPVINCPRCGVQYRGGKCNSCGYEPTIKERGDQGLSFADGELVEIKKKAKESKVLTCEEILVQSLYRAGASGRTWRQACGIAKSVAAKQGTEFRVPRSFFVGGREFESINFGDPDEMRRVASLFNGMFAPKWMKAS
jgi:hypothetical protein